jgi:hypothetical protein
VSYKYNRTAFNAGCDQRNPILLRTYCALVSLELRLKDFLNLTGNPGNGGHNLPQLLVELKRRERRLVPALNSILTQLRHRLTSIRSQGKGGVAQSVPATSYPHLRYFRHADDWPSDTSTDAQLHAVFETVEKLSALLTHHNVTL